jgi:hypothetical protein
MKKENDEDEKNPELAMQLEAFHENMDNDEVEEQDIMNNIQLLLEYPSL